MPAPAPRLSSNRSALLAFALVVLGCKLLLIAGFGSSTPLTDQWDIAWFTLRPLRSGQLHWQDLLQSHYEHRFVTTRLLDMLLFEANNLIWNPLLEMLVNAVVHVLSLVLLLVVLLPFCPPSGRRALLLFATLLWCLPYNYENTLNGFQSQVYLALLFSLSGLLALVRGRPLGGWWWAGIGLGLLAALSSAAGAVVFAVAAAVSLLQPAGAAQEKPRRTLATLLLAALAATAILITPGDSQPLIAVGPGTQRTLATNTLTPWDFLHALWLAASWPTVALAPLIYLPLLHFGWRQRQRRPRAGDRSWPVFAIGLWVLAMLAMLAYGRAAAPVVSRYTDYFALGLLLNHLCLLAWTEPGRSRLIVRWLRRLWPGLLWLGVLVHSSMQFNMLTHFVMPGTADSIASIRTYLASGDAAELTPQRHPLLPPVPAPAVMRNLLDDPTVRQLLPPTLVPEHEMREPAWTRALLDNLYALGLLLLCAGLATGLARGWRREPATDEAALVD